MEPGTQSSKVSIYPWTIEEHHIDPHPRVPNHRKRNQRRQSRAFGLNSLWKVNGTDFYTYAEKFRGVLLTSYEQDYRLPGVVEYNNLTLWASLGANH